MLEGYVAFSAYATLPVITLAFGLLGAAAVIAVSALMSETSWLLFRPLRYCGQHSMVVYLAFFIPSLAARAVMTRLGIVSDPGTLALIVTAAGVLGALVIYWSVRATRFRFLFARPGWFSLGENKALAAFIARHPRAQRG